TADAGTKGASSNGKWAFATGRDPDSGTRLTATAETGLGAQASVFQNQPSDASSVRIDTAATPISKNIPWPTIVVNSITYNTPNGGYSTGGKLANGGLSNTTTTMATGAGANLITGGFYISYVSTGDANTALGNGAFGLNYNGQPFSTNNVQTGLYT